jgi:hypothetical protein
MGVAGASIQKLTETTLNQENPRTDGRYVVWQGRQTNGNWDVFIKDTQSAAAAQNLTDSATRDEGPTRNPRLPLLGHENLPADQRAKIERMSAMLSNSRIFFRISSATS